VSELSEKLDLSKPIISKHIHILEENKLIKQQETGDINDKRKKNFVVTVDHIDVEFPQKLYLPYQEITHEIKLGYFSDFRVEPTCGLASQRQIIGKIDDARSFSLNERITAELLWFADGYVEYLIPNTLEKGQHPELMEFSLELSSEFPESNNNWKSDINFYVNDVKIGSYTAPGNYSDVRGEYTPAWWGDHLSQYGLLKHIRVTNSDTGIDGYKISNVTLQDLKISESPFIKLRMGIDPSAENRGGLTIFGKSFGNHPQNILLKMFYSEEGKRSGEGGAQGYKL
jgi:predicted transcriptional regulator